MDEVCGEDEVQEHGKCGDAIVVVRQRAVELPVLATVGDESVINIQAMQEGLHRQHHKQEDCQCKLHELLPGRQEHVASFC